MSRLKAAVIGVGSMGGRHARIYAELPETELVAVVGATATNCTRVSAEYGGRPYTELARMLSVEQPDLVSVAVPTTAHLGVARTALQAGCHVLVEKPMATDLTEAQALIDAAEAAQRKLMVGHIVRFDPAVRALKAHIAAGELGRIHQVVCRRIGPFPYRVRDVGVVLDLAPHDLDLMRHLLGEEPSSLYAEISQRVHDEQVDLLAALLRFPSDVIGILELNWLTPTRIRDVTVLGDRGMFHADCIRGRLTFFANADADGEADSAQGCYRRVTEGDVVNLPVVQEEPIRAELAAFVAAVVDDTDVPVSAADGLAALALALALGRSGAEHGPVQL